MPTGGAITAFAGVDPGADQSGGHESKSVRTSKSGPPELRKALFLVMDCLIQTKPQDDPVYLFMDKKRAEGRPYLVYMTAGANKFPRIYYGRVKEYLASLETADQSLLYFPNLAGAIAVAFLYCTFSLRS